MTALVTEADQAIEHYERDGVLLVRGVIEAAEIHEIRDTFTRQVESDDTSEQRRRRGR